MYTPLSTATYDETYKKLIRGNQETEKRAKKAVKLMRVDPFYPSLKSHRVNTKSFGRTWSSWITGDLRIIWDFDEKEERIILLLAIASHSGRHKEYK